MNVYQAICNVRAIVLQKDQDLKKMDPRLQNFTEKTN